MEWIRQLTQWVTQDLKPSTAFLLEIPVEEGLRRLQRSRRPDRMESQGLDFLRRVEQGYHELAQQNPEVVRLDAMKGPESLFADVLRALRGKEGPGGGVYVH